MSTSSAAITRYLARGMNGQFAIEQDLLPAKLLTEIDRLNDWLHNQVNRAVYRVGFARSQSEYDRRVTALFQSLDSLENRLAVQPYLLGNRLTESDLYLLPTLARFDSIYHTLFKCSLRRLADYPALKNYLHRLHADDSLRRVYDHSRVKAHYYQSVMHVDGDILDLNPTRVIPVDPFDDQHDTAHQS